MPLEGGTGRALPVDDLALKMREILLRQPERALLIADLRGSQQARDIHNINCGGYGRLWHRSALQEEDWEPFVLPYLPASWKLGVPISEVEVVQVFQVAGCNYRCWFCFVDYRLLKADPRRGNYLTCDSLLELLLREPFIPRVIRLSGGQPDLTPEWVPWMMRALAKAGLDRKTYLWLDDNLSNDYAWRFLADDDWDLMLNYDNFGRVGCLKGYDEGSFHFNTGAPPEHYYRQLEILRRLVSTGLDTYVYLVLTADSAAQLPQKMERLLDDLQDIHPNLPLRVSPIKISAHTPTVRRMRDREKVALEQNQYRALDAWRDSLASRFGPGLLRTPCYEARVS